MTPKKIAAAIYALPYHKRAERLAQIPVPERGIVKAHMENMAKRAQDASRRRNMQGMAKRSMVNKPGRPTNASLRDQGRSGCGDGSAPRADQEPLGELDMQSTTGAPGRLFGEL